MIQFDLRIFFKWVVLKPPARSTVNSCHGRAWSKMIQKINLHDVVFSSFDVGMDHDCIMYLLLFVAMSIHGIVANMQQAIK